MAFAPCVRPYLPHHLYRTAIKHKGERLHLWKRQGALFGFVDLPLLALDGIHMPMHGIHELVEVWQGLHGVSISCFC